MLEKSRKKEDDIIVILNGLDDKKFKRKALILGKYVSGTATDIVKAVDTIDQKDYEEFYYMDEEQFFNKVKELYQENCGSKISIKQTAAKIKEILKAENQELRFAYE